MPDESQAFFCYMRGKALEDFCVAIASTKFFLGSCKLIATKLEKKRLIICQALFL